MELEVHRHPVEPLDLLYNDTGSRSGTGVYFHYV